MAAKTVDVDEKLGQKLRFLREQRGIRRERLALDLDMGSENWRHYEAGRNHLQAWMLPVIAQSLGMDLPDLLSELYDLGGPCQAASVSGYESHNNGTANYNYTESAKPSFQPSRTRFAPPRELVGASR